MLLPHGTIVAVLDGRHFHLLRNAGDEANPDLAEVDAPKLDTHNHSGASHRDGGAAVMTEDAHVLAAVDWLNHAVQAKRIEHLVIIAPPRSMGEIRKAYTKALEQKLLGELAKDLAAKAPAQVLAALRGK